VYAQVLQVGVRAGHAGPQRQSAHGVGIVLILPCQAVAAGVQPLLDHLAARVVGGAGHIRHAAAAHRVHLAQRVEAGGHQLALLADRPAGIAQRGRLVGGVVAVVQPEHAAAAARHSPVLLCKTIAGVVGDVVDLDHAFGAVRLAARQQALLARGVEEVLGDDGAGRAVLPFLAPAG
jgi:hypothetical protein